MQHAENPAPGDGAQAADQHDEPASAVAVARPGGAIGGTDGTTDETTDAGNDADSAIVVGGSSSE